MRLLLGAATTSLALLSLFSCTAPGRVDREAALDVPVLRVGTFNVHYLSSRVPEMAWEPRRRGVAEVLRRADADLVAFQEMETFEGGSFNEVNRQREYLDAAFPELDFAATGDPREYPDTQPILYRPERLRLGEQGYFFFSDTPDLLYSRPSNGGHAAFASWARFRDLEADRDILVVNVHLDARRLANRLEAAELIVQRLQELCLPGEAVVVLGDFNAPWFFRPVQWVADFGLTIAPTVGATFHFNRGLHLFPAIDHVLAGRGLEPHGVEVDRSRVDGVFPSDHYPVFADLVWMPAATR